VLTHRRGAGTTVCHYGPTPSGDTAREPCLSGGACASGSPISSRIAVSTLGRLNERTNLLGTYGAG